MGLPDNDPDADVDSFFDAPDPEPSATAESHAAVTLRPAASRGDLDPNNRTQVRLAAIPKAVAIREPAAASSNPRPIPATLASAVAVAATQRGVLGYVVREVDGSESVTGTVDPRFADRVAYVSRLASLLGDELGLEGLREVHAVGAERRVAAVLGTDGASLAVLALADADLDNLGARGR